MILFKKKPLNERIYVTIYELPLSVFMEVVCDKNIKRLIKKGEGASMIELNDTWRKIFEQYVEAIKDKGTDLENRLQLRIEMLKLKINKVNSCAVFLRGYAVILKSGNQELIDKLGNVLEMVKIIKTESQTRGAFNIADLDQWEKDILMAETCIKRYQLEIDEMQSQLQLMQPTEKKIVTKEMFLSTLTRMSRWAKVQYRPSDITVFEFVRNLNDWKEEVERINSDNKRKANGR